MTKIRSSEILGRENSALGFRLWLRQLRVVPRSLTHQSTLALVHAAFLQQYLFHRAAFLLSTLAFSGSYGYFNRANISARSSDMPSLLCNNV